MSKKISFADAAVNTLLVLMTAAAVVLLCIYFIKGKPSGGSPTETAVPHVIGAAAEETAAVSVSETETSAVTEETTTALTVEFVPPAADYAAEFFDDAFFIGDSLSVGMINYEFVKPENIFAQAGITPSSVTKTIIDDKNVYQRVSEFAPKYICIMLGTNGLSYLKTDYMAEKLGTFIDELKKLCPDAKIIVASIPPVTQKREEEKPEKLDMIIEYNEQIKKLAEDKSIAFADVFSLLKDETGYLGSDYAEHDGLHLKIHAYPVILSAIQNALTEFYGEAPVSSETSLPSSSEPTTDATTVTSVTVVPASEETTSKAETTASSAEPETEAVPQVNTEAPAETSSEAAPETAESDEKIEDIETLE